MRPYGDQVNRHARLFEMKNLLNFDELFKRNTGFRQSVVVSEVVNFTDYLKLIPTDTACPHLQLGVTDSRVGSCKSASHLALCHRMARTFLPASKPGSAQLSDGSASVRTPHPMLCSPVPSGACCYAGHLDGLAGRFRLQDNASGGVSALRETLACPTQRQCVFE